MLLCGLMIGVYETWLQRKVTYTRHIQQHDVAETLRVQPAC